ncbi:MAG TPA: lysophospholipid acyltransferase family protein, partial [Sunxiuqinia sp.]|nr:lysophospholipid acyltransferase family protein [Sunxiuqinia sp.]
MRKLLNYIGFALVTLLSLLPFWLLYAISDLLFVLVFHVVKYRRKVVWKNLSNSFPQKEHKQLDRIMRNYFHHFCDLLVESFKLKTMSEKQLRKRMVVKNPEFVDHYFDQGKSVLALTMHYNNWEWNAILPKLLKHKLLFVYNPARNLTWDAFINGMRKRFGAELVSTKKIVKTLLNYRNKNIPTFTWLSADQRPKANTRFWTTFLNQDTGFFPGPEALARHTNQVVLYQHLKKVKRGHYE